VEENSLNLSNELTTQVTMKTIKEKIEKREEITLDHFSNHSL